MNSSNMANGGSGDNVPSNGEVDALLARDVEESMGSITRYMSPSFYGTSSAVESNSNGPARNTIVYCVHGKPGSLCATVVSDSKSPCLNGSTNAVNQQPIILEDHCHQARETKIDRLARRKLIVASVLCLFFMVAEVVGGYLSSSLAIATDAAHLLTDFASFMISLFALWVGARPATRTMPFGWYRAEVLGALTSVLMIWVVTGILLYMAVERVINMNFTIETDYMLITSAVGVIVNVVMATTLHQHHGHSHGRRCDEESSAHRQHIDNINVRAAYIHVLGDIIQSVGVLIASFIIYYKPDWKIVDPICTFIFSLLVLITTFNILRDTMMVLMEGIPRGYDFSDVLNTFLTIEGVVKVHNLRIWALSLDKTALAAHLAVLPNVNTNNILKVASQKIHDKFNFFEMTLQIEEFQEQMINCKQCQHPEA